MVSFVLNFCKMKNILTKPAPRTPMDIFKSLPEGTRVQLIEDVIMMEPCPAYSHQNMLLEILMPIANFIRSHRLGKVLFAPFDVYLDQENVFRPDMFFISRERLHLIKKNGLHGAPDLVAEVLSPSTSRYDRKDKKRVYEHSGVKEYWIIDPDTHMVQGFRLIDDIFKAFPSARGMIRSALLQAEFEFSN